MCSILYLANYTKQSVIVLKTNFGTVNSQLGVGGKISLQIATSCWVVWEHVTECKVCVCFVGLLSSMCRIPTHAVS